MTKRHGSSDADLAVSLFALIFMLLPLAYPIWIGILYLCGVDINAYDQS